MGLNIFKVHHLFYNLLSVCIAVSLQKPTLLSNLWKTCKYKTIVFISFPKTIIIKVKIKSHFNEEYWKKSGKKKEHCL